MPSLPDSFSYDNDEDIIANYENKESEDDQRSIDEAEEQKVGSDEETSTARRIDPSTSHKRIVRNPIPKLNTERLKGPKGIQTIENYFEGFKFHGRGHEKIDLDRIMKRMEHWAHRLFPKLHFDDFLDRVEKLGVKRDLQVFIKKYRLDMLTDDALIIEDDINDEEDKEANAPIDEFDLLIAEQIEKQKQLIVSNESTMSVTSTNIINTESVVDTFESSTASSNMEITNISPAVLKVTDEMKERIEKNRQQAIQRRLARLKTLEEETKKRKVEESIPITLQEKENALFCNQEDMSNMKSQISNEI